MAIFSTPAPSLVFLWRNCFFFSRTDKDSQELLKLLKFQQKAKKTKNFPQLEAYLCLKPQISGHLQRSAVFSTSPMVQTGSSATLRAPPQKNPRETSSSAYYCRLQSDPHTPPRTENTPLRPLMFISFSLPSSLSLCLSFCSPPSAPHLLPAFKGTVQQSHALAVGETHGEKPDRFQSL